MNLINVYLVDDHKLFRNGLRLLLNGLDNIGLTLEKKQSIENFEAAAATSRPWL